MQLQQYHFTFPEKNPWAVRINREFPSMAGFVMLFPVLLLCAVSVRHLGQMSMMNSLLQISHDDWQCIFSVCVYKDSDTNLSPLRWVVAFLILLLLPSNDLGKYTCECWIWRNLPFVFAVFFFFLWYHALKLLSTSASFWVHFRSPSCATGKSRTVT